MKVVQELVAYFDRRGQLSKKEVRQLLDKGYLAADAPPHMLELGSSVGASFYFRVKGETEGPLWGTDVYTSDSALAVAAVHAGLVKPGDSAVIKVTVVAAQTTYQGSVRNGVTSHDFGRYGSAYRLSGI
ncbi:LCCL domain-containing protein [Pseudorhodoplanes sp.]|uniref:LCCL domain-containing protein n=1 Tax=Pseudorhodoplanes sp. TaxID=1934341 RepID=UPI002C2CA24E|nr:LCCL domain-containing protein [Pseudorhodoplanes sp.]HWV55530.1 LCCL domain-containing protein [Pseudorhodoplanes sp.]